MEARTIQQVDQHGFTETKTLLPSYVDSDTVVFKNNGSGLNLRFFSNLQRTQEAMEDTEDTEGTEMNMEGDTSSDLLPRVSRFCHAMQ